MYQWLNRTAAVCCLLQSVNSWIDWLGYWWRLVAGVDLFVAALKVSITWLDGWRLARSSGSAEDRSRLFVSFPLVSSRSSIKESETCLCEQWLIFDCSQFYCHLGFKTTNKGLVDLKFFFWCFYFMRVTVFTWKRRLEFIRWSDQAGLLQHGWFKWFDL